jgi:D-alanyl-D-alanine carboxypeptidase (penicillin-binding protein 5/6)
LSSEQEPFAVPGIRVFRSSVLMAPSRWFLSILIAAGLALAPAALAQKKDAPHGKDEPQINAPHAILIDAENGSVLYQHDPDKLIFPASLAKLMTVEYVFHLLKEGKVQLTDEFPVSEYAWRTGGAPSHSSTMYAAIHSKVPVGDLLRGAIIQSGNDACIILAEGIAGNESNFATKLTERAREIGLEKSVFANSNGLPNPDTHVTTRELAMLARHIILDYPDLYPIFGEPEFTWNKIRQYNRNPLLKMSIGADGLKTGFTKEAGYGLVGSAVQNGLRLIVVVNGEKSAKERGDEAKKLIEWGFRSFEQRVLFEAGTNVGTAKVYGGADSKVSLIADRQVRVMMPKAGGERLIARIVYTGPVPAPVKKGQQIGAIKVWRGDNLILTQPLTAADDVGKGTLTQRAFDALSEMVIALFRAGAERL